MAGELHPWLRDGVNVSKSVGRSRLIIDFQDAAELAVYDMSLARKVSVGDWIYVKDNTLVGAVADDVLLDGNGNRWRRVVGDIYLLPFSSSLGFGANELLLGHEFRTAVSFPENFDGSSFRALTTATSERRWPLYKNAEVAAFGEIVFAPATALATFESDAVSFAPDDYLRLYSASGVDASLANVFGTLIGSR